MIQPNLQKYIEEIKPHNVVAVGGDGTVTMVAKLILASEMNWQLYQPVQQMAWQ